MGMISSGQPRSYPADEKQLFYLAVCAIVKDEEHYLPEWIEFHSLLGVEHFYIYDNGSALPLKDFLKDEVLRGRVTVIDFPGPTRQLPAYSDCIGRFGKRCRWIAFIDLDEFLFPVETNDLPAFLKNYESYGGLGVNWVMFGSSGHNLRPPGLQIENYTYRTPDNYATNRHIKSIVQPPRVCQPMDPHIWTTRLGFRIVNEDFSVIDAPLSTFSTRKIRINHYWTRSYEEFQVKVRRGRADVLRKHSESEFLEVNERSTVEDTLAFRFLGPLKERLRQWETKLA